MRGQQRSKHVNCSRSLLATQSFFVLQAMANSGVGQVRRVVPRALGKWRGSTLSGYLKHDDQTYLERFRATRAQLDGLVIRLQGSQLDSAENRIVREIAGPPPSRHHHRAQLLARHLHGGAPARRKRAGLSRRADSTIQSGSLHVFSWPWRSDQSFS